jgi:hypothetical protein
VIPVEVRQEQGSFEWPRLGGLGELSLKSTQTGPAIDEQPLSIRQDDLIASRVTTEAVELWSGHRRGAAGAMDAEFQGGRAPSQP